MSSDPRRVYTIVLALLAALPAVLPALADSDITVDPVMVKGALRAPVTIVEFSDYQ